MKYLLWLFYFIGANCTSCFSSNFSKENSSALKLHTDGSHTYQDVCSSINDTCTSRPIYISVKTNALYDLLLVPNLSFEVAFKKTWSINTNWMYAWWHNDRKHNYWRIYGGDLELRRWLGKRSKIKPLQGHHIGVYGQILTYDFEFGGRGYLGDKWSYAFGASYGYSHPISRRMNLDFTIGLGYLGGKYKEYLPQDDCYVWQSTKQRHWFGPTKVEVSLVWLLGRNNVNKKKGGGT